jgi:tetratricopeptide (TPR) repeat protein
MAQRFIFAAVLLACSCTGVRSVQVQPPVSPPLGLVSGYGVEKVSGNPERARQAAYFKAMDDLLTRSGPVLVSKSVQDQTTVTGLSQPNRTLVSTFRLRASALLHPSFERTGMEHGFVWVLLASTEEEMELGWQQFVAWRQERIERAQQLFQEAKGPQRVHLLQAALALLADAGAADDGSMIYHTVKSALDDETTRLARLERFHKEFETLRAEGRLAAAETALEDAQRAGLDQRAYQKCSAELSERRDQAMQLILAGDDLVRSEKYKEARSRYEQARKIDRDNTLVADKIAMADRFDREARARTVRATVGFVIPAAMKTLSEYFEYKREEEIRKREEAERAAEEARRREEEEREAESRRGRRRR